MFIEGIGEFHQEHQRNETPPMKLRICSQNPMLTLMNLPSLLENNLPLVIPKEIIDKY